MAKQQIIDSALALVRGPRIFDAAATAIVRAAADAIENNGGARSRWEHRVLDTASRLQPIEPSPSRGPSPVDQRIERTERELAPLTEKVQRAVAALGDAQLAATRAATPEEADAIARTLPELELAVHRADGDWLQVKARLLALQLTRDAWYRDAFYEAHHAR